MAVNLWASVSNRTSNSSSGESGFLQNEGGMKTFSTSDSSNKNMRSLMNAHEGSMIGILEANDEGSVSFGERPSYDPIDAAKPVSGFSNDQIMSGWRSSFGGSGNEKRGHYADGGAVETSMTGAPDWGVGTMTGQTPSPMRNGGETCEMNPKRFHDKEWSEKITPRGKSGSFVSESGKRGHWSDED